MSDWRLIETAPKDETKIDLWVIERFVRSTKQDSGERVADAWWGKESHPPDWGYERRGEAAWVHNREPLHDELVERELRGGSRFATHWMPLPEPPK